MSDKILTVESRGKKKPPAAAIEVFGRAGWNNYLALQAARNSKADAKRLAEVKKLTQMVAKDGGSNKVSLALAQALQKEKRLPKKLKPIAATKIGGKGAKVAPDGFPPGWPHPKPNMLPLFLHTGSYSFATPNPQVFTLTPSIGNPYKGITQTALAEYADALTGSISLGFAGGDFRFTTGAVEYSSPLPETFSQTDGITATGSVFEVADISALAQPANLIVSASLQCPVRNEPALAPYGDFDGLFDSFPGLNSSAMNGLIDITAYFYLTVSALKDGTILSSASSFSVLLGKALAAQGKTTAWVPISVQDFCIFIEPGVVDQTVYLDVPITVSGADQLVVEAQVRLVGMRGGVDDPGAGWLGVAFQGNLYHPVTPVDLGLLGYPCPFTVTRIAAFALI
jgi:hypothetical protein